MKTTLLLTIACAAAFAQNRPAGGVVDANIASVANLPAQKIAANDLIAVSVYDSPELTRTVRVSGDGLIRLPMLKQRIVAEGLLPGQLENVIAEELRSEQILVDPIVTVTIVAYESRPISVVGAVKKPLTFQAAGRVTLLDALAKAEGLTAEAGPELVLTRPEREGVPALQRIPVKELIEAADPALNVLLTGGEEVRAPEARKIYVVGNVKRPGAFPVRDGSENTVLKVLALAEGLAPYAGRQAFLYRAGPDPAVRKEIAIELQRILKREAQDVALEPDDVLYVPDNSRRRATATVIDRLTGFGAATTSGVLIWRR